jgi:hypothetical protein
LLVLTGWLAGWMYGWMAGWLAVAAAIGRPGLLAGGISGLACRWNKEQDVVNPNTAGS